MGFSEVVCSSEMSFIPHWVKKEIKPSVGSPMMVNNIIYVFPFGQDQLKKHLKAILPAAHIYMLGEMVNLIESSFSQFNGTTKHFIFVSESGWGGENNASQHNLFLTFLQRISSLPIFKLSALCLNAMKGPSANAVVNPVDSVYLGLCQTFAKESGSNQVACYVASRCSKHVLENILSINESASSLSPIFIEEDHYSYKVLKPTHAQLPSQFSGFKRGGCYLILGGSGGLGLALTDHLIKQYQAQVIWIGRSQPRIELLNQYQAVNVIFDQADLTDLASLTSVIEKYPNINGIIHSALSLDDAPIFSMSSEKLQKVLAPKVLGTINLIKAIENRFFDFILFFSSIQSFIANKGQANYTAACLAKDALAQTIEDAFGIKTHIINWGYWGEQGIVSGEFYRKRMEQAGVGSITASEGIAAIEYCLQNQIKQMVMVKASSEALEQMNITTSEQTMINYQSYLVGFDRNLPAVIYNKKMMDTLDHYVKFRLSQTELPIHVLDKFDKLNRAIKAIQTAPEISKQTLLDEFPSLKAHVDLFDICLENLSEVLKGNICPLSVMFPNGSFSLVEGVYRNNPVADYYNETMATAVQQFCQKNMPNTRMIRILEVGAGTGSTTQKVLPKIKGHQVEYVYTDLSHAFLNKARQAFSEYDFVVYKILNIEKEPFAVGTFDIILATNVIHATSDINKSIENIYSLLSDNGILLLNEITSRQDYATLTFGLTDGWWFSQDQYRIENSPLLDDITWQKLLKQAGFNSTCSHGDYGQHVIEACKTEREVNSPSTTNTSLKQEVKNWLADSIASVMHMDSSELKEDTVFSDYGIDSLISLELLKPLTEKVGYVPATILFEYPTLAQLTDYFIEYHQKAFSFSGNALQIQYEKDDSFVLEDNRGQTQSKTAGIIKEILATVLHMPEAEILDEVTFSDIGVDSLISMEIVQGLSREFGYLPATILFEYPTLALLSQYIDNNVEVIPQTKQTEKESEPQGQYNQEKLASENDIAIIGISGKFPKAGSVDALWKNLCQGSESFTHLLSTRWRSLSSLTSYTDKAGLIDDVSSFDHQFFNIAPIDAQMMDPQERLFLQTAYQTIEDSGLKVEYLKGKNVGCYVGVMNHGYADLTPINETVTMPSSRSWSMANRVSYQFDWHGPSFAIDSACSSSLTTLHTAVSALLQGDCEMALVGGVNIISSPKQMDLLSSLQMLSPTEQCKPFGAKADGFVDGEGVIGVMLMPYHKAIEQNLRVHALIKGSATNAGGRANGYSAPNPTQQTSVIEKALERAQVDPSQISFIEAHGTGTELGDPIEIKGLNSVFANQAQQSIPLGSIKGNIGHLESAAGLGALAKVIWQMKHKTLVPSINSQNENPFLNLSESPFVLNKSLRTLETAHPIYAGLSSFGAGGANAHVIVGSIEQTNHKAEEQVYYMFPFSAHSKSALQKELINLRYLLVQSELTLAQLSYGYCCIRSQYKYRTSTLIQNRKELVDFCSQPLYAIMAFDLESESLSANYSIKAKEHLKLLQTFNQGKEVKFSHCFSQKHEFCLPEYPFDTFQHWVDAKEYQMFDKAQIIEHHQILGHKIAPAAFSLSALHQHLGANHFEQISWDNVLFDIKNCVIEQNKNGMALVDKQTNTTYSNVSNCSDKPLSETVNISKQKSLIKDVLEKRQVYQYFDDLGYCYGETYQGLQQVSLFEDHIMSMIYVDQDWGYDISPALLDSILQTAVFTEYEKPALSNHIRVPYFLESWHVYKKPQLNHFAYCYCKPRSINTSQSSCYDIELISDEGKVLMTLSGVMSVLVDKERLFSSTRKKEENKVNDDFMVVDFS